MKSTSVTKFEDGRNRLLLTSLVVHYLLYCLILSTGSAWLETGCPEYDHSESPESAWEELTWKTRAAKGSSGGSFSLRCYDYQDFNSQHAMLSLFILELAWLAESDVDLAMAGPSISEFMQIAEWIGISRLRQTVIWQNGQITAILSGLVSGLRATTEANGPLNINRNFRFHVLVFESGTSIFQPVSSALIRRAAEIFQTAGLSQDHRAVLHAKRWFCWLFFFEI